MPSENAEPPVFNAVRSSRRRRFVTGVVVLLFLILLLRFLWITSHTETGWETVSQSWRDATVGLVAGEYQPIGFREPADQAAFWLTETDRIVAQDPKNPELMMGTALLLAEPGPDFELRHTHPAGGTSVSGLCPGAINASISTFDSLCHPRCLALAQKATELEPNELRWWRLRAALLFVGQRYDERQSLNRVPDWLAVLEECRRHDPNNALYDYLAASHYWMNALDYSTANANPSTPTPSPSFGNVVAASVAPPVPVIDQAKYNRGWKHLLNGLPKPFCSDGGTSRPPMLVLNVLRRSVVYHAEHYYIVSGSHPVSAINTIRDIWQVIEVRTQQLDAKGNIADALALLRQSQRMLDQCARYTTNDDADFHITSLRLSLSSAMKTFVEKHPQVVSAEEAARVKANAEKAEDNLSALRDATIRLEIQRTPPDAPSLFLASVLAGAAASTLPLLLFVGAIACITARRLRSDDERDAAGLGVVRCSIAWLVGCLATFVTFGMAPAGIIPEAVQNWLFPGMIALFVALVACWICWKVAVRRKFQFSIRFLLLVTAIWAVLLGLLKTCDALPGNFSDLHAPEIFVPAKAFYGTDARLCEQQMVRMYGRWSYALHQWRLYQGPLTSAALALAIIAFWHKVRLGKISVTTVRNRWGHRFAGVGRPMLVVAALWMLAYLWLAPTAIQSIEREYQTNLAYIEKPQEYTDALKKTMTQIREEPSWRKGVQPGERKPK